MFLPPSRPWLLHCPSSPSLCHRRFDWRVSLPQRGRSFRKEEGGAGGRKPPPQKPPESKDDSVFLPVFCLSLNYSNLGGILDKRHSDTAYGIVSLTPLSRSCLPSKDVKGEIFTIIWYVYKWKTVPFKRLKLFWSVIFIFDLQFGPVHLRVIFISPKKDKLLFEPL